MIANQTFIPRVDTDDLEPKTSWVPPHLPTGNDETFVNMEPENKNDPKKKKERSLVTKVLLSVAIVVAIIGIGILLPLKLIPGASNMLANVFNSNDEDISTTTPEVEEPIVALLDFTAEPDHVSSGQSTKISWSGPLRENGKYALNVACFDQVSVTLDGADGVQSPIVCGEPFYFLTIDNTMSLIVEAPAERITVVPLAFSFIDETNATTTLGSIDITVEKNNEVSQTGGQIIVVENGTNNSSNTSNSNSSEASSNHYFQTASETTANSTSGKTTIFGSASSNTNSPNTSSQNQNTTQPKTVVAGKPDLTVRVIAVGIVNKSTNNFTPATSFNTFDRVAVQFEVINIGSGWSGPWQFNSMLPTFDDAVYTSDVQSSLGPGGRIFFTLAFDGIRDASQSVMTIQADSFGRVSETNEGNNVATASFRGTGSSGTGTGKADLKATLVDTGRMNGSKFVEDNNLSDGDDAAVQFKVTNIGGSPSGTWKFTATKTDEDSDDFEYESANQKSLLPGQTATLTVAFKDIAEGDYEIEIIVDSDKDVNESTRSNNDITTDIEVDN